MASEGDETEDVTEAEKRDLVAFVPRSRCWSEPVCPSALDRSGGWLPPGDVSVLDRIGRSRDIRPARSPVRAESVVALADQSDPEFGRSLTLLSGTEVGTDPKSEANAEPEAGSVAAPSLENSVPETSLTTDALPPAADVFRRVTPCSVLAGTDSPIRWRLTTDDNRAVTGSTAVSLPADRCQGVSCCRGRDRAVDSAAMRLAATRVRVRLSTRLRAETESL
ncbi:hypothetical protein C482_02621 [Natrialba chahannaoensis JCM 10990]|uniref:Uncharacterized protein n=1 Tax=Natrialba chahannaoensis JCM 10990 TaxID=1227492 RepID=M0B3B2_9EURY|nr:hypothetical protein C482_02621 [Natrialba chahannaoensis JCM 10990]